MGNSPAGFGIYDLLTRVIPGAFVLLAVFGGDLLTSGSIPDSHVSVYLLVFGILALIVGEAVKFFRSIAFPVPTAFRRFLHEQEVDVRLGRLDSLRQRIPFLSVGGSRVYTQTRDSFWDEFTAQFDLEDDFSYVPDIYRIFLAYIEPKLSQRVRRQQTIFHFFNNMSIAIVGAVLILFLRLINTVVFGELTAIEIAWPLLVTILSTGLTYLLAAIFGPLESEYVNDLIVEYYTDRVTSTGR